MNLIQTNRTYRELPINTNGMVSWCSFYSGKRGIYPKYLRLGFRGFQLDYVRSWFFQGIRVPLFTTFKRLVEYFTLERDDYNYLYRGIDY